MNLEHSLTGKDIYGCSKTNILSSKTRYFNINHHIKPMWILEYIDSGQLQLCVGLLFTKNLICLISSSVFIIIRLALLYKAWRGEKNILLCATRANETQVWNVNSRWTYCRQNHDYRTTYPKLFILTYGVFFSLKSMSGCLEHSVIKPTSHLI